MNLSFHWSYLLKQDGQWSQALHWYLALYCSFVVCTGISHIRPKIRILHYLKWESYFAPTPPPLFPWSFLCPAAVTVLLGKWTRKRSKSECIHKDYISIYMLYLEISAQRGKWLTSYWAHPGASASCWPPSTGAVKHCRFYVAICLTLPITA